MTPGKIMEYGLYVRSDGVEFRYRRLPEVVHCPGFAPWQGVAARRNGYIPAHHVVVLELDDGSQVEETTIRSIKVNCGEKFICPRPHGVGWQVHNDDSDNFTIYRRPLPSGDRAMFDYPDDGAQ